MNRKLTLLSILALCGISLSIYQTHHFYEVRGGTAAFKSFCNVSETMNCDHVTASRYAEFFGLVPLSSLGAAWFLVLLIASLFARDPAWRRDTLRFSLALVGGGTVISLSYLFIMAFVLKTFCLICLGTDVLMALTLAVMLTLRMDATRKGKTDQPKLKPLLLTSGVSFLLVPLLLAATLSPNANLKAQMVSEISDGVLTTAPVAVNIAGSPFIGAEQAPVTIVEFSDFQCPHCRHGALIMNSLLNRFPGKVKVVLRNFPLDAGCNRTVQQSMHPASCEAARATFCANQQGKFREVYESMFENQDSLAAGKPTELARTTSGLDFEKFQGCMASPEAAAAVSRDVDEGVQLGIQSTPTFFINGRKVQGAYPAPVWEKIIEQLSL